jgi:AbrB family looped-hinge helix DNA binding protein
VNQIGGIIMPFVKVLRGGQITMPKELREVLEIKEGDILEVQMEKNKVILKPKALVDKDQAWARLHQIMAKVGKIPKDLGVWSTLYTENLMFEMEAI